MKKLGIALCMTAALALSACSSTGYPTAPEQRTAGQIVDHGTGHAKADKAFNRSLRK